MKLHMYLYSILIFLFLIAPGVARNNEPYPLPQKQSLLQQHKKKALLLVISFFTISALWFTQKESHPEDEGDEEHEDDLLIRAVGYFSTFSDYDPFFYHANKIYLKPHENVQALYDQALNKFKKDETKENAVKVLDLLTDDSKKVILKYAKKRNDLLRQVQSYKEDFPFLADKNNSKENVDITFLGMEVKKLGMLREIKDQRLLVLYKKAEGYHVFEYSKVPQPSLLAWKPADDFPLDIFDSVVQKKALKESVVAEGEYIKYMPQKKLDRLKPALKRIMYDLRQETYRTILNEVLIKHLEKDYRTLKNIKDRYEEKIKNLEKEVEKIRNQEEKIIQFLKKCDKDETYKNSYKKLYGELKDFPIDIQSQSVLKIAREELKIINEEEEKAEKLSQDRLDELKAKLEGIRNQLIRNFYAELPLDKEDVKDLAAVEQELRELSF